MFRKLRYVAIPAGIITGYALVRPTTAHASESSTKEAAGPRRPWDVYCEPPNSKNTKPAANCEVQNGIEQGVAKCRQELTPIKDGFTQLYDTTRDTAKEVSGTIMAQVKYLQTDASEEIRMGTIAGAFVIGYLLSIRRRFLRKVFNGTLLATATAAVIFPKDAKCIAKNGYVLAKSVAQDAYSAVAGGKQ